MAEYDIREGISQVIAQLTAAVTSTGIYSPGHPQVAQYIDKAYVALNEALAHKPEVTVLLIGDDLIADNRPLPAGGAYAANFARILRRTGVERVTFEAGVSREELKSIIIDFSSTEPGPVRSSAHITLGKVELRVKRADEHAAPAGASQADIEALLSLTTAELDELKDIYINIKRHRKIDVRGVDDIVKNFIKGFRREINPLTLLASLKSAHEYTFTHVANVGILTMGQAESLGFKGEQLHQIGVASLLHDVGKLFIPEDILEKPGKLTDDEFKIIQSHTVKGARYLMGLEGIPKLAVLAALEHHLKYDGSGYPTIRSGWKPNIVSQIICIADVFDAMRSKRAYQEAHSVEKIEAVLRKGSGASFNPQLVDHFIKLIKQ